MFALLLSLSLGQQQTGLHGTDLYYCMMYLAMQPPASSLEGERIENEEREKEDGDEGEISWDSGWSRGLPINNTTKTSCVGLFPAGRSSKKGAWALALQRCGNISHSCALQLASGGRFRAETSKLARKT